MCKVAKSRKFFYIQTLIITSLFLASSAFADSNSEPNWAGFYAGANLALGLQSSNVKTTAFNSANPNDDYLGIEVPTINQSGIGKINSNHFIIGIQGGYNWQISKKWLTGLELDFNSFDFDKTRTASHKTTNGYQSYPSTYTLTQNIQTNWLATIRPRIGWTTNYFFTYLTAGLALTQFKNTNSFSDNYDNNFYDARENASASTTQIGWVVGAGVEWLFTEKWSLKTEYLYLNFNNLTSSGTLTTIKDGGTNPFTHSADLQLNIIRAGINYHF